MGNEAFLESLGDEVAEPSDLGLGLVGDGRDGAVVGEDAPGPVAERLDFLGDLGLGETEKVGDLFGGIGSDEQMAVVGVP